jgi:hypothetical protein
MADLDRCAGKHELIATPPERRSSTDPSCSGGNASFFLRRLPLCGLELGSAAYASPSRSQTAGQSFSSTPAGLAGSSRPVRAPAIRAWIFTSVCSSSFVWLFQETTERHQACEEAWAFAAASSTSSSPTTPETIVLPPIRSSAHRSVRLRQARGFNH